MVRPARVIAQRKGHAAEVALGSYLDTLVHVAVLEHRTVVEARVPLARVAVAGGTEPVRVIALPGATLVGRRITHLVNSNEKGTLATVTGIVVLAPGTARYLSSGPSFMTCHYALR